MSYLTFNEGVFADIADRVNKLKDSASETAGNIVGAIKNGAIRAKNLANSATETLHSVGNKLGLKGFEDGTRPSDLHNPINTSNIKMPNIKAPNIQAPNMDPLNVKHIVTKSGFADSSKGGIENRDKDAVKAFHNLQNLGRPNY